MAFGDKSRRGRLEALLCIGVAVVFVLFAGLESQRLAKLDRDTAQKAIHLIDAADMG